MRLMTLVSVVAVSLIGAGCEQKAAPPKPLEAKTFVLITRWGPADVEKGARGAADSATAINVVQTRDAKTQVDELTRIATAGDVHGVAIDCVAAPEVAAAVRQCVKAGVPVVTYNGDCPGANRAGVRQPAEIAADPGRHSFVGTRLEEVARLMGAQLLKQFADVRGVVAIVSAPTDEYPNLKVIEDAVTAYLKDVPDLTVRAPVRPATQPDAVAAAIKGVLQQESSVRGWIILNPAAAPDATAAPLDSLSNAVVVMLGVSDTVLGAVTPEKVDVLVSLPVMAYGSAAIQMLTGIVRHHRNYADETYVGPDIVTISNVEAVQKRRSRMRAGEISAEVVPSGGPKPGQTTPGAEPPAEPAPAPVEPVPAPEPPADTGGGDATEG